jgi:hypothetical protein
MIKKYARPPNKSWSVDDFTNTIFLLVFCTSHEHDLGYEKSNYTIG